MKKALGIVLSAILVLALLVIPVQAAQSVSVSLPVTQNVTLKGDGAKAEDAAVSYVFTAVTAGAPMPFGAQDGSFSFELKGETVYQIPDITFTAPGTWSYKLCADGSGVKPTEMSVTVYVMEEQAGLTAVVIAKLPNGEKSDLDFTAVAEAEEPAPPEPPTVIYTVTFDSEGGSPVPEQKVKENETAVEPEDPTREGYTFEGWYLDEDCTIPFDFATPIMSDIMLYAKWTKIVEPEPPGPGPHTGEFRAWSLINLICAVLTAGCCGIMMATAGKNRRKLLGLLPAIAAGAIFLLYEHMSLPMELCDKFTPLMVGLLAINVMLAYLTQGKTGEEKAD